LSLLRIIHIVENLDKGAVENWLVNIFLESRKIKPDSDWTFFCILGKKGCLDVKVNAAGGTIIHSPYWISDKINFVKFLHRTLRNGRYDIIHSHHDYLSGFYLLATAGLGFKKRILHIHNTDKSLPIGNTRLLTLLLGVFRRSAIYFSDLIIGISKDALKEFMKNQKLKSKSSLVLYYGIDFSPFAPDIRKEEIRKELAITEKGIIMLFVGRMNELKNPVFVVDILRELTILENDAYAVFVGKGDKEEAVIKKAEESGISDRIRMLGWRNDTAKLMLASNVFVFPRVEYPKEGLGLVVVEAQAAGLPMILSYGIVEDAIVIKELAHFVPLRNNATEWAQKIHQILREKDRINQRHAYECMMKSKFALRKATEEILALYNA
jgi:glycosyltransferase involved in cell wall biosynthesis